MRRSINGVNSYLPKPISTNLEILERETFKSWDFLISSIAGDRSCSDTALFEASRMINSGIKPYPFTLVHLIRSCSNLGFYSYGEQLHCYAVRSGFVSDLFVSTSLINFYTKFELLSDAHNLFDEIPQRSLVSWNSLISGYVHLGKFRKALDLFIQLEKSEIRSDSFSFTSALAASAQLNLLILGKSIHSKIIKFGVESSVFVSNCLIDMYGKCDSVEYSFMVFNHIVNKDIISWNSIIASNARNRKLDRAYELLHQMPNPDTISFNEVINGFAQFGDIDRAIEILWKMPNPNSSSWNSIVTGCVNRGFSIRALRFFHEMHLGSVKMDCFTFSSILSGISSLSNLVWGSLIHCLAMKHGLDESIVVGSSLINMYSKCGELQKAELAFGLLRSKNLVTWNAMISGYANNGLSTKALSLFEEMKKMGLETGFLRPDSLTFLNVLTACWHNRASMETVKGYFRLMIYEYGIDPTAEHCSCMIKIMGQEGEVWRGEEMINELGFGSCGMVWRALLGACASCGDVEIGRIAAKKVIELEGDCEFVYVMMSNLYAGCGKWREVGEIREVMRERRVRKEIGYSWVEVLT